MKQKPFTGFAKCPLMSFLHKGMAQSDSPTPLVHATLQMGYLCILIFRLSGAEGLKEIIQVEGSHLNSGMQAPAFRPAHLFFNMFPRSLANKRVCRTSVFHIQDFKFQPNSSKLCTYKFLKLVFPFPDVFFKKCAYLFYFISFSSRQFKFDLQSRMSKARRYKQKGQNRP